MNKMNSIERKLKYLNIKMDYHIFNVFRIITCIIIFTLIFILLEYGYIAAPIIVVICYYLFEYLFLDLNINKVSNKLSDDANLYFSNFLLVFKSNKNIIESIKVTNKVVNNSISLRFESVLDDVKIGKTLEEALNNMLENIPNQIVANIIVSLIESNRDGNDITDSVNKQLDLINLKNDNMMVSYYKLIPFKIGITSLVFVVLLIVLLIAFNYIF